MAVSIRRNEQGMVAIVVTIIFLIVVSLTSLALARTARRESRQALDNQLSTQALYLAQAGVNDAIKNLDSAPYNTADKTTCPGGSNHPYLDLFTDSNPADTNFHVDPYYTGYFQPQLGGISALGQYSCMLISHTVSSLAYNANIKSSVAADMTVVDGSGTPYNSNPYDLVIGWTDDSGGGTGANGFMPSGSTTYPPTGSWTATTGILRADISSPGSGVISRAALNNTMTGYLYPNRSATSGLPSSTPFVGTPTTRADKVNNPNTKCNSTVTNPTGMMCNAVIHMPTNSARLLVRLKAIYRGSNVVIAAQDGGTPLKITGAQTLIDVTGKVNDVVKRLQVRVSTTPKAIFPEYAIESVDGICKLTQTEPSNTTFDSSPVPAASARDLSVCNPAVP